MENKTIIQAEPSFKPEQNAETQTSFNVNDYLVDEFNEIKDVLASQWQEDLSSESSQTPSAKRVEVDRKNKKLGMWPTATLDRFAGQSPAQIQMLENIKISRDDIYEMAEEMSEVVLSSRILEVRFSDNTIYWKNRDTTPCHTSYYLESLAVKTTFLGDDGGCYIYSSNVAPMLMSAVAIFGYGILTNEPQGFLLVEQGGEDIIYELEGFSLAAYVDNDPSAYAFFEEWEKLDDEHIFFTCFNKTRKLLNVETRKVDGGLFTDFENGDTDSVPVTDSDAK